MKTIEPDLAHGKFNDEFCLFGFSCGRDIHTYRQYSHNIRTKDLSVKMGDEMDECACFWNHEFAMRRLLALVRNSLRKYVRF